MIRVFRKEITELEKKGAIRCWHGENLDDIPVLRSKRDLEESS